MIAVDAGRARGGMPNRDAADVHGESIAHAGHPGVAHPSEPQQSRDLLLDDLWPHVTSVCSVEQRTDFVLSDFDQSHDYGQGMPREASRNVKVKT